MANIEKEIERSLERLLMEIEYKKQQFIQEIDTRINVIEEEIKLKYKGENNYV